MVATGLRGGIGWLLAVALVVGGPIGSARADTGPVPEPATGVTASADDGDVVTLQWTPSTTVDVVSYVARGVAGLTAPADQSAGFGLTVTGNSAKTAELRVNGPFSFSVFAVDVLNSVSKAASVTLDNSAVTITPSTSTLVFGKAVTFSGLVTDRQTGRPRPNAIVTLIAARLHTQDYGAAVTVTADANGRWITRKLDPALSYQYVAIAHSGGDHLAGASAIRVVTVAAVVIVDVVAKKVKHGKVGQIIAAVPSAPTGGKVGLQRLVSGKWTKAGSAKQGKDGTAVFTVKLPKKGVYTYRATRAADADHLAGTSKTVKITAT
jgi:hypothetical protein